LNKEISWKPRANLFMAVCPSITAESKVEQKIE
jgi:hypothetical protein